jgi:hypothetical protein
MDNNKPLPLSPPGIARSLANNPNFSTSRRSGMKETFRALKPRALERQRIREGNHQFFPTNGTGAPSEPHTETRRLAPPLS